MRQCSVARQPPQLFWPRVVMRKWLNISTKDSDYSADTDNDSGSDSDCDQDFCDFPRDLRFKNETIIEEPINGAVPKWRRRKSETFRAQYINVKDIRVCAATWNVGGKVPPDDLDIDGWLDIDEPADIYVIGFQEIIPLNAGNIFGAEDNRPITKWENIIRESLNKIPPVNKYKCYSDPPSPSRFKPLEDALDIGDVILMSDSDNGEEEEIYPLNIEEEKEEEKEERLPVIKEFERQLSTSKGLDRLGCFKTDEEKNVPQESSTLYKRNLTRTMSGKERIVLSWPEPQLNLLAQINLERLNSLRSLKSFKATKSFNAYNSFKLEENRAVSDATLLAELDLKSIINRKRRSQYVRIVSKQMVGVFVTIWVRRSLRKHIQNLHVSTVGVGAMGYIGNKGSISVSMSIYQTLFCFVCTHLTSGEKEADLVKRNADVHEIHKRTHFNSFSTVGLLKTIYDHERIIWLGDLNYRLNLSYDRTRELISKKEWTKLFTYDQLMKELKKGGAFDGWCEGILNFAPTYKYDSNSENYVSEEPKAQRRTPAWCDRILSRGKGMRLLSYRRSEVKFSDHRPVTASYIVEVEVFSSKKLQRALTFTDAEIENDQFVSHVAPVTRQRYSEKAPNW